jgi:hypothetical protein
MSPVLRRVPSKALLYAIVDSASDAIIAKRSTVLTPACDTAEHCDG